MTYMFWLSGKQINDDAKLQEMQLPASFELKKEEVTLEIKLSKQVTTKCDIV